MVVEMVDCLLSKIRGEGECFCFKKRKTIW